MVTLSPNHLRLPREEKEEEAVARLAARRVKAAGISLADARKWAKSVVASKGYTPLVIDPPPTKSGLVRDLGLRRQIRRCLEAAGLDPDDFKAAEMKKLVENGGLKHGSGVPIRSAVLLRTMSEPVLIARRQADYATGQLEVDTHPGSTRAYLGGNNHHVEIREDAKGNLSGQIVSAFEAAQRKLTKLRAFRAAGIPKPDECKRLSRGERHRLRPLIREIECAHPIVDRRADAEKGGSFVMSLSEGETLLIRRKMQDGEIGEPGYYVVAKLDRPQSIVLVPHWDARAAKQRKDTNWRSIENSEREQFSIVPSDLRTLAPEDNGLAVKVLVSPLGSVTRLHGD